MSVRENYAKTVRQELGMHPVWEPGTRISLGDYGMLQDGIFQKLGQLDEFLSLDLLKKNRSTPSSLEFLSSGTQVNYLGMEGEMNANTANLGNASGEMQIKFERRSSLYLKSYRSYTDDIANLEAICSSLRDNTKWDRSWVLVSSVRVVANLALILAASDSSTVSLKGRVEALKSFELGDLKINSGLVVSGDAAYRALGTSGPLLLKLVRIRRFFKGLSRAAGVGRLRIKSYEDVLPESI
jgi:hypothetical protein